MLVPIGIDLGTTFSAIACFRHGRSEIVLDGSTRLIPSMVYYDPNTGEPSVGQSAYENSVICPTNLLTDAKRIIGRKFTGELVGKLNQAVHTNLKLTNSKTDMAAFEVEINDKYVIKTPEEVSGEVLKYLRRFASEYLGEDVTEAVVSIPAYFSGSQRTATMKAAELAGLKILKLITEPVAAALHYGIDKEICKKIMVFDFGGGTLDVSIIDILDKRFEVKGVFGDTLLGGRNIDAKIGRFFYNDSKLDMGERRKRILRRFHQACTLVKEQLSSSKVALKIVECYGEDFDLKLELSIEKFNELNEEIFNRAIEIVEVSLYNANCNKEDIGFVVLVGGSSRISRIRELLRLYFGTHKVKVDLNPDEAVVHGACLQAAMIKQSSSMSEFIIREVTPFSLGLSVSEDLLHIVMPKNTPLPADKEQIFQTRINNQKAALFSIFEGDRKKCSFNNLLGGFQIENLPQKMAGDVSFTVKFSLDQNGILTVTATENITKENNSLRVTIGNFHLGQCQSNVSALDLRKQKEDDELFEKFILHRNKLLRKCWHWVYRNQKAEISQKCKNFIKFAEQLDYTSQEQLDKEFNKLIELISEN